MDNQVNLFIMVLFSSVGLGYFVYGKKQRLLVPTLIGVGLMVYPYLVKGTVPLVVIGLVGAIIPWLVQK